MRSCNQRVNSKSFHSQIKEREKTILRLEKKITFFFFSYVVESMHHLWKLKDLHIVASHLFVSDRFCIAKVGNSNSGKLAKHPPPSSSVPSFNVTTGDCLQVITLQNLVWGTAAFYRQGAKCYKCQSHINAIYYL